MTTESKATDWPAEREAIRARMNAADRQRFTASHSNYPSWDDIRCLLAHSEEYEREIERLREELRNARDRFSALDEGAFDADHLRAELTLRDQRISELKQEAQIHAQEARTANATINEIYQAVSGATGEVGNWHGAEPVRVKLAALRRANEEVWERAINTIQQFTEHEPDCDSFTECEDNNHIHSCNCGVVTTREIISALEAARQREDEGNEQARETETA